MDIMHASAPAGMRCSDCTIDGKACDDCFYEASERAYWEFDTERKRTGAERDAFKRQLRWFAYHHRQKVPLLARFAALLRSWLRRITSD